MKAAQGIHSEHANVTHGELADEQLDQVAGGLVDEIYAAMFYAQYVAYVTYKVMSTGAGAVGD